jgi:PHP family Zn ribbon phosphoesterase
MRFFLADLHIHTVLSACAEVEMLPELIVERARELGLDIIAVTDHNSAENTAAVVNAAQGTAITVLPGMEVQTREEVHLICLFDTLEQVGRWQEEVYDHLPPLRNDEDAFGMQVVLAAGGEIAGRNERLLLTATSFSVEEVVQRVHDLNGLCIPAHVDRPAYSIIANLGFIPPDLGVAGVEISSLVGRKEARERFPELERYSLIANGDAHRLHEMVKRTTFKMAEPTVAEIALALAGEGDRGVWVDGIQSVRASPLSPRRGGGGGGV